MTAESKRTRDPEASPGPALELRRVRKVFGRVVANDDVNITVRKGSIHGLVGENGAGKSTCMKMLYGLFKPDDGLILLDGKKVEWRSPIDAIQHGVGMVHQHFMLSRQHSVLENILVGAEPVQSSSFLSKNELIRPFLPVAWKQAAEHIEKLKLQFGFTVGLHQQIGDLPVGQQQQVELLKVLYRHAKILILDEPTAVLTPLETTALFENLCSLRDNGYSIVMITHKLEEILAITDEVTVLRAGKTVATNATKNMSIQELANLMVGRPVNLSLEVPAPKNVGTKVLEVHHQESLLKVHAGEIVGIAGVEGNGQHELFNCILQIEASDKTKTQLKTGAKTRAQVKILGQDVSSWKTKATRELDIGVIPFDRNHEALLLSQSLERNAFLGYQMKKDLTRFGFIRRSNLRAWAKSIIENNDVRPPNIELSAQSLSGGNQQKFIAGRELDRKPQLILAANPTRGVDVGAIEAIHKKLIDARDRPGKQAGILLFSSDLDEILTLSDRIGVMFEGKIVAWFQRGACQKAELGLAMGGKGTAL